MGIKSIVWDTSKTYMKKSSVAGLNHAANSMSYMRSLYWLVVFSIGFALTVVQLVNLGKDYGQAPVLTNVELEYKSALEFPAVTVCNLNRVNCLELLQAIQDIYEKDVTQESINIFKKLNYLANITGCMKQVCAEVMKDAPHLRRNNHYDKYLLSVLPLECEYEDMFKSCYYMYQIITFGGQSSNEYIDEARHDWIESQCTVADVCEYVKFIARHWSDSYDTNNPGFELFDHCTGNFTDNVYEKDMELGSGSNSDTYASEPNGSQFESQTFNYDDYSFPELENLEEEDAFTTSFLSLDDDIRKLIGHQFDGHWVKNQSNYPGFFRKCSYQGKNCNFKEFWHVVNKPGFGNCFTFDSKQKRNESTSRRSSLTGAGSGLILELYVDQFNYMRNGLSEKAGVRMMVHPADSYPMPNEFGLDLSVGTANSIAIGMTNITRLPAPAESNCTKFWNKTHLDLSKLVHNLPPYSQTVCRGHRLQLDVIETCDCFHPHLDLNLIDLDKVEFKNGPRPCATHQKSKTTDKYCLEEVLRKHGNEKFSEKKSEDCRVSCQEIEYATHVTSSTWPSDNYWKKLALEIDYEISDIKRDDDLRERIQANYLKADIYFMSLNVKTIEQKEKYNAETFISALGGAMSLYLGFALILFFELIELSFYILVNIWKYLIEPHENRNLRQENNQMFR